MKDKIYEVKEEIDEIIKDKKLVRIERYNLIRKKIDTLSQVETKILVNEYIRAMNSYDRIAEVNELITVFFTAIGFFITILGIFFGDVEKSLEAFSAVLWGIGVYVIAGIVLLSCVQAYRSRKLNEVQYILGVLNIEDKKSKEKRIMEYKEAIKEGFELYDKIETEICSFLRISDEYTDISYSEGIFTIVADSRIKNFEAKVEISRDEICKKVLVEGIEPKDAISFLLREKVCLNAHERE